MASYALVGDSQAVGLRPHLRAALAAQGLIEAGAAVHVGWSTSRMVASREVTALNRTQPDLFLVVLGGNDRADGGYVDKLEQLVAQIRSGGNNPRVVWVGPARVTVLNERTADIAAEKAVVADVQRAALPGLGVDWLDGAQLSQGAQMAPDGLHFTRVGLEVWANAIASAVLRPREGSTTSAVFGFATGLTLGALGLWWLVRR